MENNERTPDKHGGTEDRVGGTGSESNGKDSVWNNKSRAAYQNILAPKVAEKVNVLSKMETELLVRSCPILSSITFRYVKNKMNADVQRLKRLKKSTKSANEVA